jgi:hypothetical protein
MTEMPRRSISSAPSATASAARASLERLRYAEHAEVVEAAADDLNADRKAAFAEAAVDRGGRIFRHVPRHGVADVLERFCGSLIGEAKSAGEIPPLATPAKSRSRSQNTFAAAARIATWC